MGNNIEEAADVVLFHLETAEVRDDLRIVIRATGKDYSADDVDSIANLASQESGVPLSGRFVPESDHKLAGETIIEFAVNTTKEAL